MTKSPITVVKIGGSLVNDHGNVLDDIAKLHSQGHKFVIVHGGSREISCWLDRLGIESKFHRGLRVTTEEMLEVVVAVLGLVTKRLVAELQSRGTRAHGLSGADDAIISARRYDTKLGFVGRIARIDATGIRIVLDAGAVAVLAPIAIQAKGNGNGFRPRFLNVNADTVAGAVAAELQADELVFLTDVDGVLDATGTVIDHLEPKDARRALRNGNGVVRDGMVPKVEAALKAKSSGVETVVVNGTKAAVLQRVLKRQNGSVAIGTVIA